MIVITSFESMADEDMSGDIGGQKELIEWFGSWPRFLDSEVLSIHLNRSGFSAIRIHTFEWTGKLSGNGHYVFHKHVVVTFLFEQVGDCELVGFNHQNVINGLELEKRDGCYQLILNNIFGVGGSVSAKRIQIKFEPGIPEGSQYSK